MSSTFIGVTVTKYVVSEENSLEMGEINDKHLMGKWTNHRIRWYVHI